VTPSPYVVEIARVTKKFPGVLALEHIRVGFRAGEVHAVVGENGAGKSTLMHILAGDLQPSEGEILVDGKAAHFSSPLDSRAAGIVVVYQELALCPTMTIAENVVMSDMARRGVATLVPRAAMRAEARAAPERLGMHALDPETRVNRLSVAEMQLVEIARAVRQRARVLVLDEPNSALSRRESDRLFDVVRQLRTEGVTVIYVSHHLREVLDLADRVTIMRDDRTIETADNKNLSEEHLIRSMVGRNLGEVPPWHTNPAARSEGNPVILSVTDLTAPGLAGVSFSVHAGEILGVGGLPDSGKDGLGEALFGLHPRKGSVAIDDAETPADPLASIRSGMSFVPADRRGASGLLAMTVADNVVSASLRRFSVGSVLQRAQIRREARAQVARLDARIARLGQKLGTLSGGNQQKIILGRSLVTWPRVLVMHEPTRGVDVRAKADIYGILRGIASEGVAIVLISSEIPELIMNAERVLVMRGGRISGVLRGEAITEAEILGRAMAS
jgi:ABC-type sugar transport system ATPase subunit